MFVLKRIIKATICFIFLLVAMLSVVVGSAEAAPANDPTKGITFLTKPNAGSPMAIARRYLDQNKTELGLSSIDIAGAVVINQYTSSHNGVTHIYFRQQYHGIEVHNAIININVAADGSVINVGNRFIPGIDAAINTTLPLITRGKAISAAARGLGLDPSKGAVSRKPISTKLVYQPVAKNLVRLAWDLEIYELDAKNWWSMRVDAINGVILDQKNYVAQDSYTVYPVPVESPSHGGRSEEVNSLPWIDAGTVCTKGNNVDAYLDTNNSNSPTGGDSQRACGVIESESKVFDFPIDLGQSPGNYQNAAVTNLFYWNNVIHDVFYQYGFDESSGNFQQDNGTNGGLGDDSVNAEAQDGGGTNNANFATPPDGQKPRMQMYLWNLTNPARDGDLDNGIIIHEYGHGISNRLTGGPDTTTCLSNTEQAGEGWSDFFALLMTIESGDSGSGPRGIGTYALGQTTSEQGIRDYPYSTDMAIDPRTYDEIKTAAVPHGVGSTWAAMLWEMTWALIDEYGFSVDLYNGNAGNNIALQLVIDGLKLQPCSPGFADARDAILAADLANNNGVNQCLIWQAFARRGLGFSAEQGSSASRSDGTQAFDLPFVCQEVLSVTATANPAPVEAGQELTYSLQVENRTTDLLTNVTVTDIVPMHTSYIGSSATATCSAAAYDETVSFDLGGMTSGASASCEFTVLVDVVDTASGLFSDDMENGAALWTTSHGAGSDDWALSAANPHSSSNAWFAPDTATSTDQYLTMTSPVTISGDAMFRFWHHYDTEAAWDGGVVEVSVNGGAWTDLGNMMIKNGYNSTINLNPASAIEGREAFSGNSGDYIETLVDLSSYQGASVQIRFRMATDGLVGGVGWYVDDVEILDNALLSNQACVSATGVDIYCDAVKTVVTPVTAPPSPHIAVNPESLSSTQISGVETTQSLTISNTGTAPLDIINIETDSLGTCSAPDNLILWCYASPLGGQVGPSATMNVDVVFDSAGLAQGFSQTGALCVSSNDSANPMVAMPLTLNINDQMSTQLATGEIPGKGVVSGNYIVTRADDGNFESVTEQQQGGKPANRFDALEHTWIFQLQTGTGLTVNANAWVIDAGNNGDEIRFYYSTDNVNYTWFYTLTEAFSLNSFSAQLPDQGDGAFYIKAVDSDKTKGNNDNASLYVDYLSITEGGTTVPLPSIDMTISNLADDSAPSNRANRWDAIVRVTVVENGTSDVVEGAVVSGNWSSGASGGGNCTTNSSGQCTIKKPNLKQNVPMVRFTIGDVVRGPEDKYVVPVDPANKTINLIRP